MNNNDAQCCSEEMLDKYAQKLKVCGHPLRLKLLCLIERNSSCVSDLWQCLNQPQPVISQHLAVLKDKNIVSSITEGNKRIYSIVDPFVKSLVQSFDNE
ncbi:ArsR/SmtB family transcription factor [Spirochaeta cellobiosiphila]|uniref:ArsR/SmtB family transcription factor n=1 Tax=Spirochaeta cellobiosiphila TaxID=504483 RepID=UPI00048D4088|nr:metalloregulator ArsR/SmtB family transcription factor [Spirochaeta cellobiosiphila]